MGYFGDSLLAGGASPFKWATGVPSEYTGVSPADRFTWDRNLHTSSN